MNRLFSSNRIAKFGIHNKLPALTNLHHRNVVNFQSFRSSSTTSLITGKSNSFIMNNSNNYDSIDPFVKDKRGFSLMPLVIALGLVLTITSFTENEKIEKGGVNVILGAQWYDLIDLLYKYIHFKKHL